MRNRTIPFKAEVRYVSHIMITDHDARVLLLLAGLKVEVPDGFEPTSHCSGICVTDRSADEKHACKTNPLP